MSTALRIDTRRQPPQAEGIALDEVLRLFEECRTSGLTRLVARVEDDSHRWIERAITTVDVLASGDLLVTLGAGDAVSSSVHLEELMQLVRARNKNGKARSIFAVTADATTLVCLGVYVAQRNASTANLTFVPSDVTRANPATHYRH